MVRFGICMLLFLSVLTNAFGQNQPNQQEVDATDPIGVEINGLIIDKTRTKMGRDFYQLFYTKWDAPVTKTEYVITISEQPSRGRGSQIFVYVNDFLPFRAFLQPSQTFIANASQQAVYRTNDFVRQLGQMQKNFGNEDLEGSGIFKK